MSEGFIRGVNNTKDKIYRHYQSLANVTSIETEAFNDIIPGGTFNKDGDTLYAEFCGSGSNNSTKKYVIVYIGTGSGVFNPTNSGFTISFDDACTWTMSMLLVRVNSASLACGYQMCNNRYGTAGMDFDAQFTTINNIDLSIQQPIRMTVSSSVSNDMTIQLGRINFA